MSKPNPSATTSPASTSESRSIDGSGFVGTGLNPWFLERKHKRKGWTLKQRRPIAVMAAARLARAALATVTYNRKAIDGSDYRVTIDRGVTSNGRTLEAVVVEVKGKCPLFLKHLLPTRDKQFSKSRWALNSISR